ncbi:AAA family ATPase [Chryseobacterium sp. PET-29]|uniref:AAA family ATPase n=1 Tax=Chryseobacterium sp. PET-29 TaxID=2983267 RepID=UPI0021E61C38|nr:AAA family ATPase [Chryseobacterium sp. PET-29]
MKDGFKLLAIRPQSNCDRRFLKNLKKGMIYKFYNDYTYYNNQGLEIENSYNEINEILHNSTTPDNLYSNNLDHTRSFNINVSAIVGKNGAGKSSLLELLYITCYIVAAKASIITGVDLIKDEINYRELKKKISEKEMSDLSEQINEIQKVYDDLDVEIVYEIDNRIRILKVENGKISVSLFSATNKSHFSRELHIDDRSQILSFLKYFFYTISINYSQYGLNENSLGIWARYLFHKNDAYQTPLVVNPYRDEGNIDVNNELHLSQTRFITNYILTNNIKTGNNKTLKSVEFRLNKQKLVNEFGKFLFRNNLDEIGFAQIVYNSIYSIKANGNRIFDKDHNVNFLGVQANYLYVKIIKIRDQYYKNVSLGSSKNISLKLMLKFLNILSFDNSHITLKLRQTLNNIRFNILSDDRVKWEIDRYTIDFTRLRSKIVSIKKYNNYVEYEELIPIACFTPTVFVLNDDGIKDSISEMTTLSSGEQHQIHTIQSILYHILNLDSVHQNNKKNIKYKNVNIIFDEIELYFHPEFQRTFLYELLKSLKSLPLKKIKNINILFCTHSPFILSDVTKQATLKLAAGKAQTYIGTSDNSYGNNIHDLLKEDFYLAKGFMGEYSRRKTKSLIYFLDENKDIDDEIDFEINEYFWNDDDNTLKYIETIGEPLLRETLREMYFKSKKNKIIIEREIERLEKLKKELE